MKTDSILQKIKQSDTSRAGLPGEHWVALGAGLAAWWVTRNHRSFLVRTAGLMAGTALVGRAASGRDGISKVLRYFPVGRGGSANP